MKRTAAQIAESLGCHHATVTQWIRRGWIKSHMELVDQRAAHIIEGSDRMIIEAVMRKHRKTRGRRIRAMMENA